MKRQLGFMGVLVGGLAMFGCGSARSPASLYAGTQVALTMSHSESGAVVVAVDEVGGDNETSDDEAQGEQGGNDHQSDGTGKAALETGDHPEDAAQLSVQFAGMSLSRGQRVTGLYLGGHRFQTVSTTSSLGMRTRVVGRLQQVRPDASGNIVLRVLDHDFLVPAGATVGQYGSMEEALDSGDEKDGVDCHQEGEAQGNNTGC